LQKKNQNQTKNLKLKSRVKKLVEANDDFFEFTPQKEAFCREYIVDLNGTQAAMRAGYAESSASAAASRMLSIDKVCLRIRLLLEERNKRTEINADTVLLELLKIAKLDIRQAFTKSNTLKEIHELPDELAASISSIEIDELFEGYGEDKQIIGQTKKIKFWDKTKSLELLGRHLALFTDRIEKKSETTIKMDWEKITKEDVLKAIKDDPFIG
jgi:phage terminase small subunit